MAKFKVGDKVRVVYVYDIDTFSVGDEGKIVEVNPLGVFRVEFENYLSEYVIENQLERVSNNTQNWWETPEGIEWLSTQQDVEDQFLKSQEKEEEKTYHVGQRFLVTSSKGNVKWCCILAQVGSDVVCFIDIEDGNRINDPVRVYNSKKITGGEMKTIAGECSFQLL